MYIPLEWRPQLKNVNSQNIKQHQDIFHNFTQNMQTDGGRDRTPFMHSLKTIDQIINITCLPMSPGFVTVVLKNPSHYKHPYSPAHWLCLLPVGGRHQGIRVLYCVSNGSHVFSLPQAHTARILPVGELPFFLAWWKQSLVNREAYCRSTQFFVKLITND